MMYFIKYTGQTHVHKMKRTGKDYKFDPNLNLLVYRLEIIDVILSKQADLSHYFVEFWSSSQPPTFPNAVPGYCKEPDYWKLKRVL